MSLAKARARGRKVRQGGWVADPSGKFPGVSFRVGGWDRPEYIAARNEKLRAVPREEREAFGFFQSAAFRKIDNQALVEHLLFDWAGVREEEGGAETPYSKEAAADIFADDDLMDFHEAVRLAISNVAEQGRDDLEADIKN